MGRRLSEFFTPAIANAAKFIVREGDADPTVTGLEYDSRKVKKGNLFFALSGLHTDGSLYIDDAISRGAEVIVHEKESPVRVNNGVVFIQVENSRFAMSPIAASFYDFPSKKMRVVGVTGTEGKSTTVYLIWQLLTLLGKKAGFFSTVQTCTGGNVEWNSEHQTTPEAPVVQRLLREMADNGCEYAVVESSSHGLSPKTNRLGDVDFCAGVLTNITHEHLEFHGTFEQYRDDKANLFRKIDSFGVINADDKSAAFFAQAAKCKTFSFSRACKVNADLVIEKSESGSLGNHYTILDNTQTDNKQRRIDLQDNLPGAFNIGNVMAALLVVSNLLETPVSEIAPLAEKLNPVRGRMTTINKGQPFELVIDYAHTPSSFETIFPPLRSRLNESGGKIISVFGSAGERDTQKRAEQGKIAGIYSDFVIITDEDPRGEKSMDILEDIACGTEQKSEKNKISFIRGENLFLIPSRPEAIRKAVSLAKPGDLVLLLGKGHENSIIYADYVMPYDEIAEAEKALAEILQL